ncbi:hypothetical protein RN001_012902 [Aquatica leii]|uniref:Uncharacterized protein n=1 Tax=Aquatica leii TaxID=1421715 RepID=A0AAN7SPP7_9COLE|nr:hypothetical protein RN001_012902 [Aquatica leii]
MTLSGIEEIKKKIVNRKNQFNHELTKIKDSCRSRASSDDVYVPSVWWFKALSFSKPYSEPRNKHIIDDEESLSSSELSVMEGKKGKPLLKIKKLKSVQVQEQSSKDAIMARTLQALANFQDEINKRYADDRNKQFGNYIVSEPNEINDIELLIDCKNEINNILYEYKKSYIKNVNNIME